MINQLLIALLILLIIITFIVTIVVYIVDAGYNLIRRKIRQKRLHDEYIDYISIDELICEELRKELENNGK